MINKTTGRYSIDLAMAELDRKENLESNELVEWPSTMTESQTQPLEFDQ